MCSCAPKSLIFTKTLKEKSSGKSSKNVLQLGNSLLKALFLFFIKFYQVVFSRFLGGNCRFYPSCSEYAIQAIEKHTFIRASLLTSKRLIKCHPFGAQGYDPVPEK